MEMGQKVCTRNWLLEVGRMACPAAITITTLLKLTGKGAMLNQSAIRRLKKKMDDSSFLLDVITNPSSCFCRGIIMSTSVLTNERAVVYGPHGGQWAKIII